MTHHLVLIAALTALSPGLAQAVPILYTATLSGPAEDPPNASPGTGNALVAYDPVAHTLFVDVDFTDLTAPTTTSHIHCCTTVPGAGTAGVATATPTFPGFPAGVTAGAYSQTFDLTLASSFNPAFVNFNGGTLALAENALAAGLASGQAYFNIHTSAYPAGEIRGFLVASVPEPTTLALLGLGFGGLLATRRKRPLH